MAARVRCLSFPDRTALLTDAYLVSVSPCTDEISLLRSFSEKRLQREIHIASDWVLNGQCTIMEHITDMTLSDFIAGLEKAGCGFVEGGCLPGTKTRVIIARREANRVRIFPFLEAPRHTRVSSEFLGRAYIALFATE